jgi:hypothetical protein
MSIQAEEIAQKQFDADDKEWNGPKLIGLGAAVLVVAISVIFWMSYTTGCSLQIVP